MNRDGEFSAIRVKLASPDQIKKWSYGEVTKPETINYRTQKPEKEGLFAEEIFGPVKDWECYCGKYKRIRYKGITCDKCGVEVTRSIVRRERMGHIELAVPVSHIWFLRGVPSKVGMILDLSTQELEKVIYFASYIITHVDEQARQDSLRQVDAEFKKKKKEINAEASERVAKVKTESAKDPKALKEELDEVQKDKDRQLDDLREALGIAKRELKGLKKLQILSELEYRDLSLKYGQVFEAGIGAEAIKKVLSDVKLTKLVKRLESEMETAVASKRKKVVRRLEIAKGMMLAGVKPDWMILNVIPVMPPDLRPMVPLDGGRFAASDLNDLYRRVINRNNRLKRLISLNAPEVIQRNEKRMLQEAVDALIDNSARRGKAVQASTGQKRALKSLADMLKGKQGRFRQNLLGKRVDYSGRSVIVVGPQLKLHECGIPKTMALELFKPFVINRLIEHEHAYNVRSAGKLIEEGASEVWDALDEVIEGHHVLLNRAPTLHRLGIQAFQPVLIEGKAIQIHPMVTQPFNADFDGDQMAVHVPLTKMARKEAKKIMLSARNLLKPATGDPVTTAHQDMVLGCYYITIEKKGAKGEGKVFASSDELMIAYQLGEAHVQAKIQVPIKGKLRKTTVGRVLFNQIVPKELGFINEVMDKKSLRELISRVLEELGEKRVAKFIDDLKELSFRFLTTSGISMGMSNFTVPEGKAARVQQGEDEAEEVRQQFKQGLLTEEERYQKTIEVWVKAAADITELARGQLKPHDDITYMVDSGARGSMSQVSQMMGMRGLMYNPAGETIELPVRDNFKEGLNVLEYFISTHGARKGLADTALRTANAGYLTRRLVDVSQDVVVREEDCGDKEGWTVKKEDLGDSGPTIQDRLRGRVVVDPVVDSKTGEVLIEAGELVTADKAKELENVPLKEAKIRSVLSCKTKRGVCRKCYGLDLGRNELVREGQAVGIVAAQAIGEPGTQLTMRTFHTGGVAGGGDITQGLGRVDELFEARPIKKPALISEIDGKVEVVEEENEKKILVHSEGAHKDEYFFSPEKSDLKVEDKEKVKKGQMLVINEVGEKVRAENPGTVKVEKGRITVTARKGVTKEYVVPTNQALWVKTGDLVVRGSQLTEGTLDLHQLMEISGIEEVQKYIIREAQYIYSTHGLDLDTKHIEIIIRQMFSRVRIKDSGATELLPGKIIDIDHFRLSNEAVKAEKGEEATADQLLLGITKASLSTDSFLSAASFQETSRVLIDAAITGKTDDLRGLKENVIIGKLIPAGTGFGKHKRKV